MVRAVTKSTFIRIIKILANEMLLHFPYHKNYIDLIRMELNALASVMTGGCNFSRFAIIGSGPLPLTSLCILDHFNQQHRYATCHNIDKNPMAILSSKGLCQALGHDDETMTFACADAHDEGINIGCFDVVYVAALVGACSERKHAVLVNVIRSLRLGALIVIRSARKQRLLIVIALAFNMRCF